MVRDNPSSWTKLAEKMSHIRRRKSQLLPVTWDICKGRNNKAFISCGPFQPYPLCDSVIPPRQRNVIMENPLAAKLIISAPRQCFDAANSVLLVSQHQFKSAEAAQHIVLIQHKPSCCSDLSGKAGELKL